MPTFVTPNDTWLVTKASMAVRREHTLLAETKSTVVLAVYARREFVISAYANREITNPPFAHIIGGHRLYMPVKSGYTKRFVLPRLRVIPSDGTEYVEYIGSGDYDWRLDHIKHVAGKDQVSWRTYIDFSATWDAYLLEGVYTVQWLAD